MHFSVLFWYLFVSAFLPMFLHFLLRKSNRWNPAIGRPHVFITIGLSVLLFLSFYSQANPVPPAFFDQARAGRVAAYFEAGKIFTWLLLLAFLLQVVFVGYFLWRIFQRD